MSLRPCLEPRCHVLVKSGRCDAHGGPKKAWAETPNSNATKRSITGPKLQAARLALYVKAECLCAICKRFIPTLEQMIRDHVIPLTEGGLDEEANTQCVCGSCHDSKTREESKRGKAWKTA